MTVTEYLKQIFAESCFQMQHTTSAGLINGKLGLCINLYETGRTFDDKFITALADDMLDEVFAMADTCTDMTFSNGIPGIGWGIEYLAQRNFVAGDTNEILSEIDKRFFSGRFFEITSRIDFSTGPLGAGYYFIKRLQNASSNDAKFSTLLIKQHLISVIEQLDFGMELLLSTAKPADKQEELIPALLALFHDIHNQDIYNSRMNRMMVWLSKNIHRNGSGSSIFKLQMLPPVMKLNSLRVETNIFGEIIEMLINSIKREDLLLEAAENKEGSLLKILINYSSITQNGCFTFEDDLIFWQERFMENLQTNVQNYKTENALPTAIKSGLPDGFTGFYNVLPLLSKDYLEKKCARIKNYSILQRKRII